MREYDNYDDENIRLYRPVLQRVIILAAVIIAVPVMMWTITSFVRSYVARPRVPTLEQLASTNMPARSSVGATHFGSICGRSIGIAGHRGGRGEWCKELHGRDQERAS